MDIETRNVDSNKQDERLVNFSRPSRRVINDKYSQELEGEQFVWYFLPRRPYLAERN